MLLDTNNWCTFITKDKNLKKKNPLAEISKFKSVNRIVCKIES